MPFPDPPCLAWPCRATPRPTKPRSVMPTGIPQRTHADALEVAVRPMPRLAGPRLAMPGLAPPCPVVQSRAGPIPATSCASHREPHIQGLVALGQIAGNATGHEVAGAIAAALPPSLSRHHVIDMHSIGRRHDALAVRASPATNGGTPITIQDALPLVSCERWRDVLPKSKRLQPLRPALAGNRWHVTRAHLL